MNILQKEKQENGGLEAKGKINQYKEKRLQHVRKKENKELSLLHHT